MKVHFLLFSPIFLLVSASLAAQGSLEPSDPPGPVMKTLDQIEPRIPVSEPGTLSASGSYYLTQSIAGSMVIDADNVSFDLNGFTISGGAPPIDLSSSSDVWILNGRLQNNSASIAILAFESGNVRLTDLTISNYFECFRAFNARGFFEVKRVVCNTAQWDGIKIVGFEDQPLSAYVVDNTVVNTGIADINKAGILIGHSGTGALTALVSGNQVFQSNYFGISVGSGTAATFGAVADNHVYGCVNAGVAIGGDFAVTRNIIQGCNPNYNLGSATNAAPVTDLASSPGAWDNISE